MWWTWLCLACTTSSALVPLPAPDSKSTTVPPDSATSPLPPRVLINELMSANEGSVVDPNGAHSDWIEIYNADSTAVDLSDIGVSDEWTEPFQWRFPAGSSLAAGAWMVLWMGGDPDSDDGRLPFSLARDGEGLGLFDRDGASLDWLLFPALDADFAWARLPDASADWAAVRRGTPGAANADVTLVAVQAVSSAATWRYQDLGEDLGTIWREPGYDDSAWASGTAPLGYGENQTTTLSYGDDANQKRPTAYFRTTFRLDEISDLANVYNVSLNLMVDDGALVWLNGVEVLRHHLPDGDVSYSTYADYTVTGGDELVYTSYTLDSTAFALGENTLAVEVHQASADSSDLILDLSLLIEGWTTP